MCWFQIRVLLHGGILTLFENTLISIKPPPKLNSSLERNSTKFSNLRKLEYNRIKWINVSTKNQKRFFIKNVYFKPKSGVIIPDIGAARNPGKEVPKSW